MFSIQASSSDFLFFIFSLNSSYSSCLANALGQKEKIVLNDIGPSFPATFDGDDVYSGDDMI